MIIFGTRGVTTTPDKGEFHCPTCNSIQPYGLKRVRRFFTLYFIPLIPLDNLGEYVECDACKDTYKKNVLDTNASASSEEFEAEYHSAIKKVMVHVLLADGVIDDSEVETSIDIYHKITGTEISAASFRNEIDVIQASKEDLSGCLRNLQGVLNDEGKELVIKAALYVAFADGEFQQEEQDLLAKIGSDLGMTKAHIQGVISSA